LRTELRVIFGCEREEVTGGWRKVHDEELHNLFPFLGIVRINIQRRMRGMWHV
jgi:hypothetical protein